MKFLYFGDVHIRGKNPRNRTDDYKESLKAKLREIWKLAEYNKVDGVLCPGDIFDRPEVTNSVLLEFAEVFKECPTNFYTTPGNHDVYSYNLDTYKRTSLRILELIVPQLHVITDASRNVTFGKEVAISFQPYDQFIDKDGYGYTPGNPLKDHFKIHIAHGMLLDHDPKVFDRYTYVGTVKTEADLVLTGHDHLGFGIYNRADGKVFMNSGAICRLAASEAEIERKVQVALITVENKQLEGIELIDLRSAKPGNEILDRSQIEADQQRQYAMDEFAALIQTEDGGKAVVDLNAIIESIAEKEGYAPEVVRIALEKIGEAKAGLKV
ncbi:metallophosphoesterase family protein [Lysinibacillus sp. 54212]|uniref:metallophosphoesterase family protein n=1 Tax=Lysinibacillus sp. 54212 TaxID=3119829 RepID=UPI002FCB6FE8